MWCPRMGHISSAQQLAFTWLYGDFRVALGWLYGDYRQSMTEEGDGLIMVGSRLDSFNDQLSSTHRLIGFPNPSQ
jgi:hypothetical protein